jgi:16S rRNA (adenine1518-N6/adenine1519-N6)-dimethyltransferase
LVRIAALDSGRQTLSYLRELFQARGIRPKSKLGQNFLIDLNIRDLIVRAADLSRDDLVLEVGAGTASLTVCLARQAGGVVSVEIDPEFFALAQATVTALPNVMLIYADILHNKNALNPRILKLLSEVQERSSCRRLKLVANLPYAVATPVISNLLLSDLSLERMVVTVQQEIGERLLAGPGTKDYGALSVLVQSLADVEPIRRQVSPAVFWPRPQVASAIVCIRPRPEKRTRVCDVQRFRTFLRDLYVHRRKNLRGALAGMPNRKWDKSEVDVRLAKLGMPGTVRSEDLDIDQHLLLSREFG